MTRVLEDFRAYEQSRIWTLQHAYYEGVGSRAWSTQAIPSVGTTNLPLVQQHARVLVALVDDLARAGSLGPTDEVRVLEVGSGSGLFAERLLRALAQDCGDEGRQVLERLTYVFSDFSQRSISEALGRGPLAALKAGGYVVPALLDLTQADRLTDLNGEPLTGSFTAVYANYVACTLAQNFLRKTPGGITQRLVRIDVEAPTKDDPRAAEQLWTDLLADPERPDLMKAVQLTSAWRPVPLSDALPDPVHQQAFVDATAPLSLATVGYPRLFFDFVRQLAPRMLKGGALFVTDFGQSSGVEFEGLRDPAPSIYGNTLNHAINFALFDSFCRAAGFGLLRTRNPLASVPRAAVTFGGQPSEELTAAFRRWHDRKDHSQEFLGLHEAANAFDKAGSHNNAARAYRRLTRLEPTSAQWHYFLGRACQRAGWVGMAIRYLRRGRRLAGARKWDFDFILGLSYFRLDRFDEARRAFKRALKFDRHGATYSNLGSVHARQGNVAKARACYEKSLALIPTGPSADQVRASLQALDELAPGPAAPADASSR